MKRNPVNDVNTIRNHIYHLTLLGIAIPVKNQNSSFLKTNFFWFSYTVSVYKC